jgi:hypothetical protein
MSKKEVKTEEILEQTDMVQEVNEPEGEYGAIYNDQGEEVLFENGPTLNKIEEWKSLYKDVYFTEFESDVFIWRCIIRNEYKEINSIQGADSFYKEERLCEKCILYPEGYNFINMKAGKAGIPTFLAEQILEKSGFSARAAAIKL